MKLRFTPDAAAELDAVLDGIAEHSPRGAQHVHQRIRATLDLLLEQPRCGVPTNLRHLRRIVVRPFPYLIFYEAHEDAVIVIGVRHAARAPSSMPDAR